MIEVNVHAGIATATLARPPVNAINNTWIDCFHAVLDQLAARNDWSVLWVRSSAKTFCAGADLAQIQSHFAEPAGAKAMVADIRRFHDLFARLEALPQVTMAEIGGAALGGGLEMALCCDLRIAAHEASLGLPEARLGLLPGAGGTQRLSWLCGKGTASRLILGGEVVDGQTACRLGLVQWSVPALQLTDHARQIACRIADLAPAALAAAKACIALAADASRDGFQAELDATEALFSNADTRRRVAAFLDR
ncbi:enoyl-CoA hydratase/isomerase family protein [Bordetella sp. BOR01]|nr:enoyl-CoA hydratase/isomerase family protein [Bordetella sp. BOR01]MBV7484865.1 enoyl-CoA hydratase/isomerase family protein [Bordetella sp. BOR01]